MLKGYDHDQAAAMAQKYMEDIETSDTLPPPRAEIDKSTVSKERYPKGYFDEIPSNSKMTRFDRELKKNVGKPFTGEYGKTDMKLDGILKSHQLAPEEFFNLKKMYQKKGISKTDEEIAKEISSSKGQMVKKGFSLDQAENTLKSTPKPFAYSGIKSPQQLAQTPASPKMDPKQRISKLRIKKEALIKMKKMNLTESQVRTVAKRAVILAERRKYAQKVIKQNIREQREVSRLIGTILEQEAKPGVWGGIKNAIGSAANAFGIGQSTAKDTGMQQAQTELVKGIKQAQSIRQKFNAQIMKNAELVNQYHDSVMGVQQIFQQVGQALGPNAQKIGEEINQLLGQFHRDLESEKQGIETYLGSLEKAAPEAKKVAASLNKAATEGPQMGSGKTKVAQGTGAYVNPATATSPSQMYKGNAAPPQHNQQPQQRANSVQEFEQFVKSKYGPDTLSKTSKKLLDKAYQKFMEKKYGTKDAQSPYKAKDKVNKK